MKMRAIETISLILNRIAIMGSASENLEKSGFLEGEKYEKGRQNFPRADVGKPLESAFYCESEGRNTGLFSHARGFYV